MAGNPTLPTENIDEVILRLLALEPNEVDEIDYQTYSQYLKELLVEVTASKRKIGAIEFNSLKDEFKRVKGKKGRFRIKKAKITATGLGLGGIRKQVKAAQNRLMLAPVGGVPKLQEKIETISQGTKENPLLKISKTLDSILNTLIDIGKQDAKEKEKNRRSEEEKKRTGRESSLESKTFDGLKKAISSVIKPFQSIWDKIVNFIFYTFLGRVVVKLFDWFSNKENQDKVKSLIRFIKDWWPALLGSYILFGTKFGGLIRFVGGWAVRLAFQLGKVVIPKLLTLIAKNPFAALAVAGGIGAYAATQQNKERRDEFAETDSSIVKPEETAETGKGPGPLQLQQEQIGQQGLGLGFSGGGIVRLPAFAGGGFNFKNMMGGVFGSGKSQEMFSGFVNGPGGPKGDKIPAMLSDGEFVMSAGAVQKYGVDTLEGMNAAGGGTNKPKVVSGTTYAAGGGYIGPQDDTKEKVKDPILEKRKNTEESFKWNPNKNVIASKNGELGIMTKGDPSSWRKPSYNEKGEVPISSINAFAKSAAGLRFTQQRDAKKSAISPNIPKIIPTPKPTGMRYTPYQSRFAGARDAAHERAKGITGDSSAINPYNPMNMFKMGGIFGGPRMQARTDYAASKGKYYSSSDQKTYGNYNDAQAAKKSRMTSLASQQRLDKLSSAGANRSSRGVRFDAEAKARNKDFSQRGGLLGQMGRGFTRMFGSGDQIQKLDQQDKSANIATKQAGAASIGRYYSSSDGKYYKDYNAAVVAKKQRLKSGVKPLPKSKPKYNPAGGGMGGGRGSGAKPSATQKAPSPSPRHRAGTRSTERTTGTNR
jgi:hypothetical protein